MTDTVQSGPRLDESGLEQLLAGLTAVRGGDFSTRLAKTGDPLMDEIATVFNGMADQLDLFTSEVTRVAREVGTEGKLGGQADVPGVSGTWKDLTESVNAMAGNLTGQVRNIAQVATAVVTWAMARTCPVRLPAIALTESVRSFQVPATPGTLACPPSRPSLPTSRATRVTSAANERNCSTIVLRVSLSCNISPRTSTVILRERSPLAMAVATSAILRT